MDVIERARALRPIIVKNMLKKLKLVILFGISRRRIFSEDGKIYLCNRDTGIAVAYMPHELVGHYFEAV